MDISAAPSQMSLRRLQKQKTNKQAKTGLRWESDIQMYAFIHLHYTIQLQTLQIIQQQSTHYAYNKQLGLVASGGVNLTVMHSHSQISPKFCPPDTF